MADPSLYDLLVSPDPATEAAALQDALRRRGAIGSLLQATGARALAPIGQGMVRSADTGEAGLAEAGKTRLGMALQAQRARQGQANADRQFEETQRHNQATEANAARRATQVNVGVPGMDTGAIDAIVGAIESGKQPPTFQGLYRYGAPVRAELGRHGFDATTAQADWQAVQKHMASLNNPQQLRLRQAAETASESLGNIKNLYNEWKQLGGASGLKVLNKAALSATKQLPGRLGAVAQALEMNIADLTSELGNVYVGGNSPTEEALRLAARNLSADWNPEQFEEGLKQADRNLGYRLNAIRNAAPSGLSPGSKYGPKAPEGEPAPAAAPVRKFQRINGKLVEVK